MVKMYSVVLRKNVIVPHTKIKTKSMMVNGRRRFMIYGEYGTGKKKHKCYRIVTEKDYKKYK